MSMSINANPMYSQLRNIFQRCLDQDMPQLDFFSLLRENDAQFLARSGWRYRRNAPVHMPDQAVHVIPSQWTNCLSEEEATIL